MARSKSSGRWLREHFKDPYVKQSQRDGYRSRASYKLIALQEKDQLIRRGMVVVDLGAAPGGWSQVAASIVGPQGRVVATDILAMEPLPEVEFLQGDFTDQAVFERLLAMLGGQTVNLVLSDMAPNISGIVDVDQPKSMHLVELATDLARQLLPPGGGFVTKAFQGEGFDPYYRDLRKLFTRVVSRKPDASRPRSREVYIVATGFKGGE